MDTAKKTNFKIIAIAIVIIAFCYMSLGLFFKNKSDDSVLSGAVESGIKYIAFASQSTGGIQLYNIAKNTSDDLLNDNDEHSRYIFPTFDRLGSVYCVKRTNEFDHDGQKDYLVKYTSGKKKKGAEEVIGDFYHINSRIALLSNESRLAFVASSKNDDVGLVIFNIEQRKVEKSIRLNSHKNDLYPFVTWDEDNRTIIISSVDSDRSLVVNIDNDAVSLNGYRIYDKNALLEIYSVPGEKTVFVRSLDTKQVSKIRNPGYLFRLSCNNKYILSAESQGVGWSQKLIIIDGKHPNTKYQVELDMHRGFLMGIDIL